jgi:hypothetical protein
MKVYIMRVIIEGVEFYKIGVAKTPRNRLKVLQTGCPVKIDLLYTAKGGLKQEREIHIQLNDFHSYGEWFKCSIGEVLTTVGLICGELSKVGQKRKTKSRKNYEKKLAKRSKQ